MSITETRADATDAATRTRVRVVAVVLAVTAVATVPGGLLWPEPSTGNETYAYGDIQPIRELWWGLLLGLATVGALSVSAQAIATMVLVKHRGAPWASWGAALMWMGIVMQAVGVAFSPARTTSRRAPTSTAPAARPSSLPSPRTSCTCSSS